MEAALEEVDQHRDGSRGARRSRAECGDCTVGARPHNDKASGRAGDHSRPGFVECPQLNAASGKHAMAVELVKVPSPGESVTEGKIAKWYKPNGSAVAMDEPLFELESDKAAQTVGSPVAGVVKILVAEGEIVAIGTVVAEIDPAGSPAAKPAAAPEAPPKVSLAADAVPKTGGEPKVSPAAGRILAEKGVEAAGVNGTGPKGVVTKDDAVKATAPAALATTLKPATPAPVAVTPTGVARETRQGMTMIRRRIAERLLESQNTTATLTTFNEADMTAIQELRAKYNERFEKKYGVKIGFMSIFVKATIEALKAFPVVNARIDGQDIVYQNFHDISVAVSTEKGLTVPVIRNADDLSFSDIEKKITELAKKAPRRQVDPARHVRRDVHDHQRRHLRVDALDADLEPAAERDPGHAQHPEAGRRHQRRHRRPADDVHRPELRPPADRRPGSGAIPGPREGMPGKPRTHVV